MIDAIDAASPDRARRVAAAERALAMDLPSAEQEVWRYSRIGELDLARFVPTGVTAAATSTTVVGAEGLTVDTEAVSRLIDGITVHDLSLIHISEPTRPY